MSFLHVAKIYKCQICGQSYLNSSAAYMHAYKAHGTKKCITIIKRESNHPREK